jgi:outer membrane lipoprotein-sorting protein
MRIRRTVAILAVVLLLGTVAASAQELTLDQILDKNIEALGGTAALKAVRTLTISAKIVGGGGAVEMPTFTQTKVPDKVRMEMTFQGQTTITAFDGTDGWIINPRTGSSEPQKLPEEQLRAAAGSSDMQGLIGALKFMREAGATMELTGKEDVEGAPAYRIRVVLKNGDLQTYFIDTRSFLPVEMITKATQGGQETEMESYPSNYRKTGGILMPYRTDGKVGGKTVASTVTEKIEINLPMDDSIFKMPVTNKPAEKSAEKKP